MHVHIRTSAACTLGELRGGHGNDLKVDAQRRMCHTGSLLMLLVVRTERRDNTTYNGYKNRNGHCTKQQN